MINVRARLAVSLLSVIGTSALMVGLASHSYAAELQQMPDWHKQLPSSPELEISLDERALIIKAMEVIEQRETSRKGLTISWSPTLNRIKSGEPITLADFIIFQGSLMTAQQIRNDGHDMTPEEDQKINNLRHRLYKEVAEIVRPK